MGAKAQALRVSAERTGIKVTDAEISRLIGTTPSALQHAESLFDPKREHIFALMRLLRSARFEEQIDTENRRQSRMRWLNLFPLLIKDGFYPWHPPTGYRRPTGGELTGEARRKIRMSSELAAKVAEDPSLEKMLRRFQLRRDNEVADELRGVILLIHEGWLPLRAAREKELSVKNTTFLALLKDPILYGMILDKKTGQLYEARADKPIISKEEFDNLQRRRPPRGGKNLFGFIWDNKKRIADPNEKWMVDIVYEMRLQKLSNPQVSKLTGMSLELVRSLFYVKSYRDLVGVEKWEKARRVKLFPEASRRAEKGKQIRLRILQAMWNLRRQDKPIFPVALAKEIADVQIRSDAIAKHLQKMETAGMVKQLARRRGYEPVMRLTYP
jgi:hypothetical protein